MACLAVTGGSHGRRVSHALKNGKGNGKGSLNDQSACIPLTSAPHPAYCVLPASQTGPGCQGWAHTKCSKVVARSEVGDSCLGPIGYSGLRADGLVPATSLQVGPQARDGTDLS